MFIPVNRHILIDVPDSRDPNPDSLIMLPEDYKPEQDRYLVVTMLAAASDVRFEISPAAKLVADRSMIEEINISGTIYNVILDNYIVGIIG